MSTQMNTSITTANSEMQGTTAMLVGSILPLIVYTAILIFYVILWKDLYLKLANFNHFNICLCLACSMLFYAISVNGAGGTISLTGCETVSFFLHFMSLSVFMWMVCEAIYIFCLMLYKYPDLENHRILLNIFPAIGYGCSFLMAAITIGVRVGQNQQYIVIRGSNYQCWLPIEQNVYWSFLAPIIVAIVIVLGLLVVSAGILMRIHNTGTGILTAEQELILVKKGLKLIIILVVLLSLMALTFGFSVAASNHGNRHAINYSVVSNLLALSVFVAYFGFHERTKLYINQIKDRFQCGNNMASEVPDCQENSTKSNEKHVSVDPLTDPPYAISDAR